MSPKTSKPLKATPKYVLRKFMRVTIKILMAYVALSLVLIAIPHAYKFIWGDKITSEVLSKVSSNTTDPKELALRIYSWEQQNFANPYFIQPENMSLIEKLLAGYGFYYDKQGEVHLFRPFNIFPVPPQWVLHSKLANCEEYAKVFVYLMSQEGVKARIVRAPGEDHAWAEYYVENYKIIFDPSNPKNPVIVNPKQFGQLKNFSYVEAYDPANPDHKEDVSDEYIERGRLIVKVVKGNEPVSGATVEVLSTYLRERFPKRYDAPRYVVVNETGKDGTTQFKLGPKEYKIMGKKCSFLICWKGESTGKVIAGSTTYAKLELRVDYVTTSILCALTIIPTGVLMLVIHKRYVYQRQQ